MPRANANGIELEYDSFGSPGDPALLLVMGLGAQMILWDEEFCEALAERGHRVVRFDNRDVGLSTKLDAAGTPSPLEVMQRVTRGETPQVPYRLGDMADDAAGLLDALGIAHAHVVGASMGGMIAQTLAIRHRGRVASLTSIMSTTGDPSLPTAKPEAMARLVIPPPGEREAYVDHVVETARLIGGTGFPFDEPRIRERTARGFDRSFHPAGAARQLAAIVASGSRAGALREVDVPALVIHGSDDPLVPVEGGYDTHRCLAGSELLVIEGMGHDLPRPTWSRIVDAISSLTARAA
jgi:pimeloyl-ACP methyl ester carboxylesterase